jgi:hypothetical protein
MTASEAPGGTLAHVVRQLLALLNVAHALAALIVAAAHFTLWRRTGYWLPRYIHFLAVVAFLVGIATTRTIPPDAPIARWGLFGQVFLLLLFPALVYFFFIFYGGHAAALRRRRSGEHTER